MSLQLHVDQPNLGVASPRAVGILRGQLLEGRQRPIGFFGVGIEQAQMIHGLGDIRARRIALSQVRPVRQRLDSGGDDGLFLLLPGRIGHRWGRGSLFVGDLAGSLARLGTARQGTICRKLLDGNPLGEQRQLPERLVVP